VHIKEVPEMQPEAIKAELLPGIACPDLDEMG